MPGLAVGLESAPKWMQEYVENIVKQSRTLSSERYRPYGQATPEQNQAIKAQIERLSASQPKSALDIIPFSITGASKVIDVSPLDLQQIAKDAEFAKSVYESTTGTRVSTDELEDLRRRAHIKLQSELGTSPEVREIIQSGMSNRVRETQENNLKQLARLNKDKEPIQKQIDQLNLQSQPIQTRIQELLHIKKNGQPEYYKLLEPELLEKNDALQKINSEKIKLQENLNTIDTQVNPIKAELTRLETQLSPNPEGLIKKASIEREVNNLQRQRGRIAPMNVYHERAISMLEKGFNDDTMKLASDELRSARQHSELRAVEPLVRASLEGPSNEYMNRYVDDYTRDIRKALTDESEEQYIKEIAPKINMSFAQMGAFHSGARAKALRESLSDHRVKLHRELAHLTGHARDKAMEKHELQKRREQSGAEIMSHAVKAEKESARQVAEGLRHQAVTRHGMGQLDVAAMGQIGRAKQEQEQHEIDVARQEHERQLLYPQEQLSREVALLSGLPPQPSQSLSGNLTLSPTPPNLFTLGAGALGSIASGFVPSQQQQQRQYKKGGSVRKYYANGGPVGTDEVGNEIRNIIKEQRQGDQSHLAQVSQHNPIQSWLRHVGNEMLTNPNEDPLLSMGRGTAASVEHGEVVKERAANLYDKIQNTRLNQYKVLAEYENMKEHNALGRAQLAETGRYHDILRNNASTKINASNMKKMNKPLSATDRKSEIDAKKDLTRSIRMKKEVRHIADLLKKTSTGPLVGGVKSLLPKTKIDNQIEVRTNKLILDMHQGMKNIPRSEEFMKRIDTTKPSRTNYPEANMDSINIMDEGASDIEQNSISTLLSLGWTPEKIERQFKIKIPEQFLGESSEGIPEQQVDELEPEFEQNEEIINMVDPEGNPLQVPRDQVGEAISQGATIAQ